MHIAYGKLFVSTGNNGIDVYYINKSTMTITKIDNLLNEIFSYTHFSQIDIVQVKFANTYMFVIDKLNGVFRYKYYD